MRGTLRLFATVKPVRYLEAGAPTGLTGLRTNASPRSTLLYLYNRTLDKLADVPETSLYRQSVEAVTKHRLGLVQGMKPEGYEEWAAKARSVIAERAEAFGQKNTVGEIVEAPGFQAIREWSYLEGLSLDGKAYYLRPRFAAPADERIEDAEDWDRFENTRDPVLTPEEEALAEGQTQKAEAIRTFSEEEAEAHMKEHNKPENRKPEPEPEPVEPPAPDVSFLKEEPKLTASQWVG